MTPELAAYFARLRVAPPGEVSVPPFGIVLWQVTMPAGNWGPAVEEHSWFEAREKACRLLGASREALQITLLL